MAVLIYPDDILRQPCADVERINEETVALADNMLETMYKNNGVGLAAPQIGILQRIIVIDVGQGPIVLFNPKILKKIGKTDSEEGCLSIPGITLKVKRAERVEAEGLDKNNQKIGIKAKGYLAYALQHEIDHLNGILILDRIGIWEKLKRKKLLRKLGK